MSGTPVLRRSRRPCPTHPPAKSYPQSPTIQHVLCFGLEGPGELFMKTLVIAALLCLFPSVSACAQEIQWNGISYKLQTVNPVSVDAYGRIVPLPPITVLVPIENRVPTAAQPSKRTPTAPAMRRSPRSNRQTTMSTPMRFANLGSNSTMDVPSAAYGTADSSARPAISNDEPRREMANSGTSRSTLLDSRLLNRNVF